MFLCSREKYGQVMDRSKVVRTPDDITKVKEKLYRRDIIDLCKRERPNTK